MANTPRGIPYPDDYTAVADVPAALEALAESADDAIDLVDTKATTATTTANTAASSAATANASVASHTHSGSGSVNIGMTAVTGLPAALAGKSDSGHLHTGVYATATHTHTATEIGAHTHPDYAATSHTHTQATSHTTPDTDAAATSLHHTLGTGATQAAAGNHTHSGYANSTHTHTEYAGSTHTHTEYSTTGHTHTASNVTGTFGVDQIPTGTTATTVALGNHTHTGFAASSHNHDSAYATASHTHNGFAASSHGHTSFSDLNITQSLTVSSSGSNSAFRVGSGGQVYSYGIDASTTDNAANVRVGSGAQLIKSTSTVRVKDEVISLSGEIAGVPYAKSAQYGASVDPYDVLSISPAEYRSLCPADDLHRSFGFVAEDVAEKFPWGAEWDEDGVPNAVSDRPILAALLVVVQEQKSLIESLTARIVALEATT